MTWEKQIRSGEALLEWGASALLAAAIGWASATLGNSTLIGIATFAVLLPMAVVAMKRVDREAETKLDLSEFAIESLAAAADDELLLDDPLAEIASDSRVATMFVVDQETPGAMIARIADYLGDRAPRPRLPPETCEGEDEESADAGAALHAALANIRASLR